MGVEVTAMNSLTGEHVMPGCRNRLKGHLRRVALISVAIAGLWAPLPGIAADYGEECTHEDPTTGIKITDFKCLYDAAVEWFGGQITQLSQQLTELGNQLLAPKEIAENLANTITGTDLGFLGIDATAMQRYTEALEFISDQNNALLGEFNAFAGSEDCDASDVCRDFRARLAGLVFAVTDVTNQALEVVSVQHGMEGQVPLPPLLLNSAGVASFIAQAPPALLFPLYYALNSAAPAVQSAAGRSSAQQASPLGDCDGYDYCTFFEPLETMLSDMKSDLEYVQDLIAYVEANKQKYGPPRDPLCTMLFLEPSVPDELSKYAAGTAVVSEVLAEFGSWLAKPRVSVIPKEVEGGASFGAGVKVTYDVSPGKLIGVRLRMLATPLRIIGEGIAARVYDCRQRLEQYLAICALDNDIKKNSTFYECKQRVLFTSEEFGF